MLDADGFPPPDDGLIHASRVHGGGDVERPVPEPLGRLVDRGLEAGQVDEQVGVAHARRLAGTELEGDPGCELYLVNREAERPDVIWVTELWRSQADLDASIERIRGSEGVATAMALVDDWEMIELDLLGGKGP